MPIVRRRSFARKTVWKLSTCRFYWREVFAENETYLLVRAGHNRHALEVFEFVYREKNNESWLYLLTGICELFFCVVEVKFCLYLTYYYHTRILSHNASI